jgi:hypothetical protein
MSGIDLSAAVEAVARVWFDRGQAGRRDDGAHRPDGHRWTFDDLPAIDQHALREVAYRHAARIARGTP